MVLQMLRSIDLLRGTPRPLRRSTHTPLPPRSLSQGAGGWGFDQAQRARIRGKGAVAAVERSEQVRAQLVETLRERGHARSPSVAAAFLAVPREVFVPGVPLEVAYRPSDAIEVKRLDGVRVSSASAPDVMAIMLEQLAVEPGQRVLE